MSAKSRTKPKTSEAVNNTPSAKKSETQKKKTQKRVLPPEAVAEVEVAVQPKARQTKSTARTKKTSTADSAVKADKHADVSTGKTKKAKSEAVSVKPDKNAVQVQPESNPEEQKPACKTPQVMKLVQESLDLNPVLLAGKSRIPMRLRGKESLTKIMRRDMGEEFAYSEDSIVVNITELAIAQETPIILDRFNACSCDKCVEVFSRIIAAKVPVRFARIGRNGRSPDNRDLSERVAPMRKIVMTEMIKELIGSKKRWFHDDN